MTKRLRLGFVCEIVLGHATYYQQVLAAAESFPGIELLPIPVPYEPEGLLQRVPPLSNWTMRAGFLANRGVAKAGPVDALLINTQTAAVGCIGAMRRTPSIISSDATPANYDELAEAYAHRVGFGRIEQVKRKILAQTYNSAAAVVAWSSWVRDSLERDYEVPSDRIRVIRAGLRVGKRPPDRADHSGRLQVLFVGADFERKGGPSLLEATRELDVDLHLVTHGDVAERPGVHVYSDITPGDPRLRELYARADVFALPTRGDASPWVLLEAMEAGLPVITSAVGAIPEIIRPEETGLLVPPGDVQGLQDAVLRLSRDRALRLRMGSAGRALVEQRHDVQDNIGRVFALAQEIAGR